MIEQLFGSKTRVKLLQLFYGSPNRSFFVREITRKIDEQINSVRRELSNLQSIGIITSENTNNKLYYEVNQQFKFYKPLSTMFGASAVDHEEGIEESDEHNEYKILGKLELLLLTGQFTRDETSGVDILMVGDLNVNQVNKYIDDLEKRENKQLRYVVMDTKEFSYRMKVNDRFISSVLMSKKQVKQDLNGWLKSGTNKLKNKEPSTQKDKDNKGV